MAYQPVWSHHTKSSSLQSTDKVRLDHVFNVFGAHSKMPRRLFVSMIRAWRVPLDNLIRTRTPIRRAKIAPMESSQILSGPTAVLIAPRAQSLLPLMCEIVACVLTARLARQIMTAFQHHRVSVAIGEDSRISLAHLQSVTRVKMVRCLTKKL